jgi:hypothetical protein
LGAGLSLDRKGALDLRQSAKDIAALGLAFVQLTAKSSACESGTTALQLQYGGTLVMGSLGTLW